MFRKPPPPVAAPEQSLLVMAADLLEWKLLVCIVAFHFALTLVFYTKYGSQRNTTAVAGGNLDMTSKPSLMATLIAYNFVTLGYAVYCAYVGTTSWFDGSAAAISGSLQERLYATTEPVKKMAALTIAFEFYNTLAVLFISEYCNAQFIGHHSCCLILGLMSKAPFMHYYFTFFFGLSAISSVPLALIEIANGFKASMLRDISEGVFAICFLIFRTVYWPIESYRYWCDAIAALSGAVHVHNLAAHLFLLLANIGLTSLQFYWTTLICSGIAGKFKTDGAAKDKSA